MILLLAAGASLLSLAAGCGPPKPPEEPVRKCVVYDLTAAVNDETAMIAFKDSCRGLKSGYNIYISPQPLSELHPGGTLPPSVEPFNNTIFYGDTDPDDGIEHFEAEGLENGVPYFVSVRTVYPDRSLSRSSEEIQIVCGPRGEVVLDLRFNGEHDGFSFEHNQYVRADAVTNDVYFYTKDGTDYLASPKRLGGFLRDSRFAVLPLQGTLEEVASQLSALGSVPSSERVEVVPGDWVWLLTAEEYPALLQVIEVTGDSSRRRIRLTYAFTPATGVPLL